jgi:hypothetical protein
MEIGRWGTKLVTRLLATAALWVRILQCCGTGTGTGTGTVGTVTF